MDKKNSTYYKMLKNYKIIMVFGTSTMGLTEMRYIGNVERTLNIEFEKYYFVGDRKYINSQEEIAGIAVRCIDEIPDTHKKEGLALIGRYPQSNTESMKILKAAGFANIELGVCQMHEMDSSNSGELTMLERVYGKNLIISVEESDEKASIQIYAVTSHANLHQTTDTWKSGYIKYIQAGAALTDKKVCKITDDTGDNISEKNAMYNETTAGYWIAKNDKEHEYVGLYHYSRGLGLSDGQMQWICKKGIDVVLPFPAVMNYEMLSFSGDNLVKPIRNVCPEYSEILEKYFSEKIFVPGNILFARREIFAEFYEWQYKVQLELEKTDWGKGKRQIAYCSEALLNLWFMKNQDRFKIAFVHLKSFDLK